MSLFRRNDTEKEELEELRAELRAKNKLPAKRKFKDLAPVNKKKRKEPPKPWGKRERMLVLGFFAGSILIASVLGLSARDWKLPGAGRIYLPRLTFESTLILQGTPSSDAKFAGVKKGFEEATEKLSGVYGLYVKRLESGEEYGVYAGESFPAASLIKLPAMISLYQESEAGRLDLDESLQGTKTTWRKILEKTARESDEAAFNTLRQKVGDRKIQETVNNIGMVGTSLSEGKTTPRDIGILFERLWKNELIEPGNKDEMLGFLASTSFEQWLKAGVPKGVKVAHKYGRGTHMVVDGGIIFWDRPYVVVILTKGVVETEADKAFPELSRLIYQFEISQ